MRVVSLACSNTEIVCALGCADYLVAVDDHSDSPADVVRDLPRVGPDLTIDMDAVLAHDPDLVLASLTVPGHEAVLDELEATGLEFIVREPVSLSDVYDDIRVIARALGVAERGETLIQDMRAAFAQTQSFARKPKILLEWWHRPAIVPGALSWVTELMALAGGENPLARTMVKSTPVTDAEVALMNPDAIVVSWCGVDPAKYRPDVIYRNEAWQDVRAVKHQQVFCVPEAYLGRPGPNLVQGFAQLKHIIRQVHAAR